ncbi:MAG: NAD(P)H-dependent oxidoreductase [archaeon]|jgi:flavodoxin
MKKALVAYYSVGEAHKVSERLLELFGKNGFETVKKVIELEKSSQQPKQSCEEKGLELKSGVKSIADYDVIVIGTPVFSFSPAPAVSLFIKSLPNCEGKKFVLFSTGIGLSGTTIKKMQSLLSMKGGKVVASESFSSIFEFDSKKLVEVEKFFEIFSAKI